MKTAGGLLSSTRRAAGVSQAVLARRAGTWPPRVSEAERGVHDPSVETLAGYLRVIGHQLVALPTQEVTAAAAAEEIRAALAGDGPEHRREEAAFRVLIGFSDGLASVGPALRVALVIAEPATTGDRRFDAAVAAFVDHHLEGLPAPGWVTGPGRVADPVWVPDPFAGDDIEAEVPVGFRRHGVLLAASELASA